MTIGNKCPFPHEKEDVISTITSDIPQSATNTVEGVQETVKELSGDDKALTFAWAHKYLGLSSNRSDRERKYGNLTDNELIELLRYGGPEEQFEANKQISNEIAVFLIHEIQSSFQSRRCEMNLIGHQFSDHEGLIGISDELQAKLTSITENILKSLYTEAKISSNQDRIHNLIRLHLGINNSDEISNHLSDFIFKGGIQLTILYAKQTLICKIAQEGGFDRKQVEEFCRNDESNWQQRGLTGAIENYLYEDLKQNGKYSDELIYKYPNGNAGREFSYSRGEFQNIVQIFQDDPDFQSNPTEYQGCPLMFTKVNINQREVNGIIALKEMVYSYILDGMDVFQRQRKEA